MKGEEFKDDYRKALPQDLVQQLTRRSAWRATAAIAHDLAFGVEHARKLHLGEEVVIAS